MCRILEHPPSLGTFCRFYTNFISNNWLSFSKCWPTPSWVSKPLDSLKGWNDHFFWIDASICLIFVSWYNDVSVKKDPLPSDDIVDLPLLDKLDNNRTLIRKYPETFLCIVGLSRSFVDTDVRPTLIGHDKSDIGLLVFFKFADPFKVKTREGILALGKVPLVMETTNMVVNPSAQSLRLVTHTIADEIKEHSGKNKRKVGFSTVPPPVKKARTGGVVITEPANVGSGSAASFAEEFVSSSVTLTLDREDHEDSSLTHDGNVQTCRASERYVVLTSSLEHEDADTVVSSNTTSPKPHVQIEVENVIAKPVDRAGGTSIPRNEAVTSSIPGNETRGYSSVPNNVSSSNFYESQTIDSSKAQDIYVPKWDVTNDAQMDDPVMRRNLIDHHICMVFELCLRYEHEITVREKFEQKITHNFAVVFELEAAAVAKAEEVAGLTVQTAKLSGKVSGLELVRDELKSQVSKLEVDCEGLRAEVTGESKMREEFASMQDVEARRFEERSTELDARIMELNHDMDIELYLHMLTVVDGRRWVIGRWFRLAMMKCAQSTECRVALGKAEIFAGRSLAEVEAYDSWVGAAYVATVNEFENVSFTLLEQLEAVKDSPLELLMSALTLEGDHGDEDLTLEFHKLQTVSEQVTVHVYFERGGLKDPDSISHEILLSDALAASHDRAARRRMGATSSSAAGGTSTAMPAQDTTFVVTYYQVSIVAITDDTVCSAKLHDDMFDATVLDKPVDS
ncbi:hypothetical protein Tco_1120891 [Tanacetum coccineum]|uniref:Transposase (Putative), gypsy type n=1 Tax=Tanacetum coccineum TaxID=301880 RepID=A0ABQ5IX72_9ASTR